MDDLNEKEIMPQLGAEEESEPVILKIYKNINDVIGGTNPNEMFCLSMPGIVLNPLIFERFV